MQKVPSTSVRDSTKNRIRSIIMHVRGTFNNESCTIKLRQTTAVPAKGNVTHKWMKCHKSLLLSEDFVSFQRYYAQNQKERSPLIKQVIINRYTTANILQVAFFRIVGMIIYYGCVAESSAKEKKRSFSIRLQIYRMPCVHGFHLPKIYLETLGRARRW